MFRVVCADDREKEISLPQPSLFSLDRRLWSYSLVELEEQLSVLGFHQTHRRQEPPLEDYSGYHAGASLSSHYG